VMDYYDDHGKMENMYDFVTHSGGLEYLFVFYCCVLFVFDEV
jgi:hypothetical protein